VLNWARPGLARRRVESVKACLVWRLWRHTVPKLRRPIRPPHLRRGMCGAVWRRRPRTKHALKSSWIFRWITCPVVPFWFHFANTPQFPPLCRPKHCRIRCVFRRCRAAPVTLVMIPIVLVLKSTCLLGFMESLLV